MTATIRAVLALVAVVTVLGGPARSAGYAEMVMDMRTGEVLRSRNANTRLHPASLTKMMTLYIAFEAVRLGEISLDTPVRISRNAAAEPPSKLGLRQGQKIALRYLIRAAAVKSANDAATAIGEAIAGSESAFAERMTRTARALGMNSTTFRNAHGLTQSGHLSTARDMTIMGRRIFMDYPDYYNIFSRRATDAGVTTVRNTNRRLLNAYNGADGIKTGYTRAAGFNLVASAERGGVRVLATVFGGRSTATRNARIVELFDMGFARAPRHAATIKPALPTYGVKVAGPLAPERSLRPPMRPGAGAAVLIAMAEETEAPGEVVTRASSSGGRIFAVTLETQPSEYHADRLLLRTALQELESLDDALRRVSRNNSGFEPAFVGLSEREALAACSRLRAQAVECSVVVGG